MKWFLQSNGETQMPQSQTLIALVWIFYLPCNDLNYNYLVMLYASAKMAVYELNHIVMDDEICFELRNSKSKVI